MKVQSGDMFTCTETWGLVVEIRVLVCSRPASERASSTRCDPGAKRCANSTAKLRPMPWLAPVTRQKDRRPQNWSGIFSLKQKQLQHEVYSPFPQSGTWAGDACWKRSLKQGLSTLFKYCTHFFLNKQFVYSRLPLLRTCGSNKRVACHVPPRKFHIPLTTGWEPLL